MYYSKLVENGKKKAKKIDNLRYDLVYTMLDSLFLGSVGDLTEQDFQQKDTKLRKPKLPVFRSIDSGPIITYEILATEAEKNFGELELYYQDMFDKAQQHKMALEKNEYLFWVSPVILPARHEHITISYHENFDYIKNFFERIRRDEDGVLYDFIEQGMHLVVYKEADDLYIIHNEDLGDEPDEAYVTSFTQHQEEADEISRLIDKQEKRLTQRFGNYWNAKNLYKIRS